MTIGMKLFCFLMITVSQVTHITQALMLLMLHTMIITMMATTTQFLLPIMSIAITSNNNQVNNCIMRIINCMSIMRMRIMAILHKILTR
jgi:hypothetical protein